MTEEVDYTCEKHGIPHLHSYCPSCVAEFEQRRPLSEMTREERVAALRAIPDQLTIPFNSVHQWVTEIMGRPVYTHEFAYPEKLLAELESGSPATLDDVIGKLPADKPVIVITP